LRVPNCAVPFSVSYIIIFPSVFFFSLSFFFFNATATSEIYTLSLHDALPIFAGADHRAHFHHVLAEAHPDAGQGEHRAERDRPRSEEHTSELQSRFDLVCRLLLEKKKKQNKHT